MSRLFNKILIATDGSENTRNSVDYGVELAKISGAKLYAIYVVDTAAFASIPMDAAWENMYGLLKKEGEEAVAYVNDIAKKEGVEVESIILEGHPAEQIVKLTQDESIDLVVMGTLGKSGLERFLLGSVAEKVMRTSKVPVMVVRAKK